MPQELYIGDDVYVEWLDMQTDEGTAVTDATVIADLITQADVELAAATMQYVSGTGSDYRGVIQSSVTEDLTDGTTYYIEIVAVSGEYNGFRRIERVAGYHGEV